MTITHTFFNEASMVSKLLDLFISIAPIEEPTDDFMHETLDKRFWSKKISHK